MAFNQKCARLGQDILDALLLQKFSVAVAYDTNSDLYLTVTDPTLGGGNCLVKFEKAVQLGNNQANPVTGLIEEVFTPHIIKVGFPTATQATGTYTIGAGLKSTDAATIAGHAFAAVDTGAAGDQWNIVGTHGVGVLTIGGGADTAFGAGKTITINGTVLTEGVDFAAGATDATSATAIAAAITASGALNTIVTAAAVLGGAGVNSTVTITAIRLGTVGNYTTVTNDLVATWGAATMTGGAVDTTLSAAALASAINASVTAGIAGVVYATSALAVVTVHAAAGGTGGNAITTTGTGAVTAGAATLAGGLNGGTGSLTRYKVLAEAFQKGTQVEVYEKAESFVVADFVDTNEVLLYRNLQWGNLSHI